MSNITITEVKQHIKIEGGDQVIQPAEESFQVLLADGEINVHVQGAEITNHPIVVQEQTQTVEVVEEKISVVKINEGSQGLYGEIHLTPKPSSSGPEGTVFYCSADKKVYVGTV